MYMNVYNSVIPSSQNVEIIQVSISWWMDKENVVNPYFRILLSHKKE